MTESATKKPNPFGAKAAPPFPKKGGKKKTKK